MSIVTKNQKTILFSGGGSAGPVTPLLAIAEELQGQDFGTKFNLVFVGNSQSLEQDLITDFNHGRGKIKFITLVGGKWRRYFSWQNFWDIFKIIWAFFQSFAMLRREKPDLIISAGGFVSVPIVWAGALKKIPILIHQQDVHPGLANKLMAPFARVITVSFESSLMDYGSRAVWIGNPIKKIRINSSEQNFQVLRAKYNLNQQVPLVLVVGGGTGSQAINNLIFTARQELSQFCQILHLTGPHKLNKDLPVFSNYRALERLAQEDFLEILAHADLVISRCGLSTLSELAFFNKLAILIPIPNSHQEANAHLFQQRQAALVLAQKGLSAEQLIQEIHQLLQDKKRALEFKNNIGKIMKRGANESMLSIIEEILT